MAQDVEVDLDLVSTGMVHGNGVGVGETTNAVGVPHPQRRPRGQGHPGAARVSEQVEGVAEMGGTEAPKKPDLFEEGRLTGGGRPQTIDIRVAGQERARKGVGQDMQFRVRGGSF
jgi:hypothetical protein